MEMNSFSPKKINLNAAAGALKSGAAVKETYSVSQLLFEQYVSKNFNFNFEIYEANKEKSLEVLKKFNLTERKFQWNLSTQTVYYEGVYDKDQTNVLVMIDISEYKGDCEICIFAETLEAIHVLYSELFEKAVRDFISKNEIIISFSDFSIGGNQISENTSRMKADNFSSISEKYYPFLDMDIFIHEFLSRQENLLVLTGDTGTGKTKFSSLILKYAIQNYNLIEKLVKNNHEDDYDDYGYPEGSIEEKDKEIRVAYLKNEDILASDQFWTIIKNKRFDFIILDDLDYMLLPRTREVDSQIDISRSKFISQLLSYTDGMVPSSTKFIITSNKSDRDIDSALMRPGRMFGILSFRTLTCEEAKNIWLDFNLKDKMSVFKEAFEGKDSINHAELGSLIYQTKLNSERRNYIKDGEKDINLTEKAKKTTNKKIGIRIEKNED